MNLAAEYAQSRKNPNIFGKAMIESMEGIKQEDSVSMNKDFLASVANPAGIKTNYNKQLLYNEDVKVLEINPMPMRRLMIPADNELKLLAG